MTQPIKPKKICPVLIVECNREECPAWLKLEGFEGCSYEFALKAVKEVVTEGARLLDDFLKLRR